MDIVKQISHLICPQNGTKTCKSLNIPNISKEKLSDVCRTSVVTKIDRMEDFQNLLPGIVANLEEMDLNRDKKFDRETFATATAYLTAMTKFKFIVSLVISRRILHYVRPATVKMQLKQRNFLESYNLVETLRNTMCSTRLIANIIYGTGKL